MKCAKFAVTSEISVLVARAFPASRSPAEIPPRIPGLMVSGRWGNDLTTIPNPVNRDMDSTHQPPPTPDYVLP